MVYGASFENWWAKVRMGSNPIPSAQKLLVLLINATVQEIQKEVKKDNFIIRNTPNNPYYFNFFFYHQE